jgi:thiol-disulfide isomerase/thioredoxin
VRGFGAVRQVRLAALVVLLVAGTQTASAAPIIGERAPALAGVELERGVVVVDFFATWCEPCHLAMAALDELVQRRHVRLVVVDVGEPDARVAAWFAAHPLPAGARVIVDGTGEASRRWGQRRFPTTFVVAGGVIRHINRGYGSGYARRLDGWIESDLATTVPPSSR